MNGSGYIFEEKVLRKDGQTDERTDRCSPLPTFSKRGYKKQEGHGGTDRDNMIVLKVFH